MNDIGKYKFLISIAMFSGNAVYFANLKSVIERMEDIEPTWLPIEVEPGEWYAKLPPFSLNWSLLGSTVTRQRVRALEIGGKQFHGALFHHQLLGLRLADFMRRTPTVITTDATPLQHDRYADWYSKTKLVKNPRMNAWKQYPIRRVFGRASYVLPFSDWTRRSVIEEYGASPEKVFVISPGIDLARWKVSQQDRSARNGRRFLFVGGDFLRKGGDLLIRLAAQEFKDFEFHMITRSLKGPKTDNVFVYDNVAPNSDDILNLYRKCDILVLPSRADFHSLAGLEAMSMSMPIVASTVGAFPEIIEEGKTGYSVPVDDERALTDRMRRLVNNSEMQRSFGTAARLRVEKHFDVRTNVAKTIAMMKKAVSEKGLHDK